MSEVLHLGLTTISFTLYHSPSARLYARLLDLKERGDSQPSSRDREGMPRIQHRGCKGEADITSDLSRSAKVGTHLNGTLLLLMLLSDLLSLHH
jgi:hypothetical protein